MKKNLLTRTNLLFLLIIILAFFFRVYKISFIPPSLNWDEVSNGYNAYSILKTGKDEWGINIPLLFRSYGDYKLPAYIYLTTVSELIFGLNTFSVRLLSILSGIGLVFLSYFITKKITKDDTISLIAAFLTALSPWGLFVSRIAVEANLGAFLFALGIYFAICTIESLKLKPLILTVIFWGFSLHAYNSARVLVPIFFITLAIFLLKQKAFKKIVISTILLALFSFPIIFQIFNRSAGARFNLVSLIDQGTVNQIIAKRNASKFSPLVTRLIFNRPTFYIYSSFNNYFSNLSFKYLFYKGGSHYQFSFPDHELLFLVMAPFLIIGLLKVFIKGNKQEKFLGLWFFLAFIPSAITKDAPHVLRTIFILPSPMILGALGLKQVLEILIKHKSNFKGNFLLAVFIFSIMVSFSKWWTDYINIYPKAYSWAWQFGYKEVVTFIKQNYANYNQIFVTKRYGEPHEFILFYYPWNPKTYQNDAKKVWNYHAEWYWVDSFDKFNFYNDWESAKVKCTNKKCLLIASSGNYPVGWNKIDTISFLDGKQAFDILESK